MNSDPSPTEILNLLNIFAEDINLQADKALEVKEIENLFLLAPRSEWFSNQTLSRQIVLELLNIFSEYTNLLTDWVMNNW